MSIKKIPGSVPLSGSTPKVNRVYSGLRIILQSSFTEIRSIVFLCNPADKPTYWQTDTVENTTSLVGATKKQLADRKRGARLSSSTAALVGSQSLRQNLVQLPCAVMVTYAHAFYKVGESEGSKVSRHSRFVRLLLLSGLQCLSLLRKLNKGPSPYDAWSLGYIPALCFVSSVSLSAAFPVSISLSPSK